MFFKVSLLVLTSMFFLVSCDLNDDFTKDDVLTQEEGLKSTTGDQELLVENSELEMVSEVVFHKSYSNKLSAEEAQAEWTKDLSNFVMPQSIKGISSDFFTEVSTHTGGQYHNGTDASVYCNIYVTSNNGNGYYRHKLTHSGNDREENCWDFYVLRCYTFKLTFQWVKLSSATLDLIGTDGWFVTDFNIRLKTTNQSIYSTGGCSILTQPNIWLDNPSSSGHDYFYTPIYTGTEQLNF